MIEQPGVFTPNPTLDRFWLIEQPGVFTPDPTMLTHRLCCALRALRKGTEPHQTGFSRQLPLHNYVGKGSDARPPQPPLRSAAPPAIQLRWQGERCIPNDISQYKRIFRTYGMDVSRVGPCVRPITPYTSAKWSLLSKGLRGGKSRRLRVESLLRRMIASEDAKNPLQYRKQKRIQGYGLAISARKEGIVEWNQGSLRRHKCNVRRINILESPVYIGWLSLVSKGWPFVSQSPCVYGYVRILWAYCFNERFWRRGMTV